MTISTNGSILVQKQVTGDPTVTYPDITYVLGPASDWNTSSIENDEMDLTLNKNLSGEKYWLISFESPNDDNTLQASSDKVTIKCYCIRGSSEAKCSVRYLTSHGITCVQCIPEAGCMKCKQETVRGPSNYVGSMVLVKGSSITIQ